MTVLHDDELEARIRASLDAWASHAPLGDDREAEIVAIPAARPRAPMILLAAAALVAIALVGTLLTDTGEHEVPTVAGPGFAPERIGMGSHGVRAIATDGEAMWLLSARDRTLYRIDPATREVVDEVELDGYFEGFAVIDGIAWTVGYDPTRAVAIDTRTGDVVHEIPLDFDPWGVELAFDAVWIGGGGQLTRIDVETGEPTSFDLGVSTGFIAADDTSLWVTEPDGTAVARVDPRTGRITGTARLQGPPRGVAIAPDGSIWVTVVGGKDQVVRIDPATRAVTATVDVGPFPDALAFVGDEVWVTIGADGTITRIASDGASVVGIHPAGIRPAGIVSAFDRVWVSLHQEAAVLAIDPDDALLGMPASTFDELVPVDERDIHLRCRGTGDETVLLVQDIWHDTGGLPTLEAMLGSRTRVCIAAEPPERPARGAELASDLRGALEGGGIPGPYVVVGYGYGGMAAKELAATWDDVAALVLLDTNTEPVFSSEELADDFLRSVAEHFSTVDAMTVDVPTVVAISDPDVATDDPRVAPRSTRANWLARHRDLAERLDAELVVITGDPWVPTYRPGDVVDLIMRVAASST